MRGYFSSLAKQSSVSIRGGQTSGARLPEASLPETLAPLHSETVLFVDSTPTTVSPVRDSPTTETTSLRGISQPPPVPAESSNISSQSRSTSGSVSNSTRQPRADDTLGPVASVENSFSIKKLSTQALENPEEPVASLVERSDFELEGQLSKKGGVIRVGESESPIEMKTEPPGGLFRRDVPGATSIPREYLAGIREWLDSPPIEIEASERRKTLHQGPESAHVPVKDRGQAMLPTLRDSGVPPQNEIKEFSLSIGSISIVVEEPPAPKQQVNHVQPQTPAPVSAAPAAHDAFALSRRYFRGF